jgi:hypothetical protein
MTAKTRAAYNTHLELTKNQQKLAILPHLAEGKQFVSDEISAWLFTLLPELSVEIPCIRTMPGPGETKRPVSFESFVFGFLAAPKTLFNFLEVLSSSERSSKQWLPQR